MSNNTMYMVKNRSASNIVYRIPEDNIRRTFVPGQVRQISHAELEKLTFQPGGREIMANFLQIMATTVEEDFGIHTEPEYNMSEQEIKTLLTSGSLDAFLDCLDFAPIGVIDLVKTFSVQLPLTDYEKRKALKEKTGFDVDAALHNIEAEKAEENEGKSGFTTTARRTQVTEEKPATPGRRTSGSGYKIGKITEESSSD